MNGTGGREEAVQDVRRDQLDSSGGKEREAADRSRRETRKTISGRFRSVYVSFSSPRVSMIFIECKRENGNYVPVTNASGRPRPR